MTTTKITPSEPPRGLRLSAILRELHADAHVVEPSAVDGSSASATGAGVAADADPIAADSTTADSDEPTAADGTESSVEEKDDPTADEEADGGRPLRRRRRQRTNITIGEILERTRQAGFGVIIALMAILSLPLPGLSVPFGVGAAFGALQMIIGLERPWMPRWIRNYAVSMRTLVWIGTKLAKYTRGLEKLSRPRFPLLLRGPFWSLCGVGILILAVGLSLPLPIPGSNMFFIVPIMVYAIGMLENDGLLIMVGHALTTIEIGISIAFWEIIQKSAMTALHWIGVVSLSLIPF